jgi:hypothetical protein
MAYEILLVLSGSYLWSSPVARYVNPSEYSPSGNEFGFSGQSSCAPLRYCRPTDRLSHRSRLTSITSEKLPSSCSESASGLSSESSRSHWSLSAQEPRRGVGLNVRGAAGDGRLPRGSRWSQSQAWINTLCVKYSEVACYRSALFRYTFCLYSIMIPLRSSYRRLLAVVECSSGSKNAIKGTKGQSIVSISRFSCHRTMASIS